jgi:2-octaprenyl-6-methoxyphenol hydroxylase
MTLPANTAFVPLWRIAVVGAGPAGLALALLAAQLLPRAEISLFDARPADKDVSGDPRTLALALGSVQLLQRLQAWPAAGVQAITEVLVSQAPPTIRWRGAADAVHLRASDEAVPMLGAVLAYGTLVASLQRSWLAAEARSPQRLHSRFGQPVTDLRNLADGGVEVDAGIAERFDLAVVAEGGVFVDPARQASNQAATPAATRATGPAAGQFGEGAPPLGGPARTGGFGRSLQHDYRQTAWVGTATLAGATPGLAVERFTRDGPLALLPLPAAADGSARAALVWCVPRDDDPVAPLSDAQRITVLNSLLPEAAGTVVGLSPLKHFALGLIAERSLVDGATVRIGNAAQTLHPVAGQGLNLGLRDAASLVHALRHATPAELGPLLRRVEWDRGPDRWAMIAATDFLARSFTWRWPGLPAARGLGLALLQALPPLKSALARQMMFGRR